MPDRDPVRVLVALVEDHPGVLDRVAGQIRRRGFNIEGLSVGPTPTRGFSRMTLTVHAGTAEVDQVEKQIDKLVEVIAVADITDQPIHQREYVLATVAVNGDREQLRRQLEALGARTLNATPDALTLEMAGEKGEIKMFIDSLAPHHVQEFARSGPVAIRQEVSE